MQRCTSLCLLVTVWQRNKKYNSENERIWRLFSKVCNLSPYLLTFNESGIDSASLCSLAGRYNKQGLNGARQAGNWLLGPLKSLQIRALSPKLLTIKEPSTGILKLLRIQGIDSPSLCSLVARYDNRIPTRFLTPIDCYKIPAQESIPGLLKSFQIRALKLLHKLKGFHRSKISD